MEGCRIIRTMDQLHVLVDADSCPVKEEIVEIASKYLVEVTFIASYNHVLTDVLPGKWVYVDTGKEAVDLYIMNHVKRQDIVITQDIGLASTLLNRGVYVLSPRGNVYREEDMYVALDLRYLSAKARRQGKHSKGPKPYTLEDRQMFQKVFLEILSNFAGEI